MEREVGEEIDCESKSQNQNQNETHGEETTKPAAAAAPRDLCLLCGSPNEVAICCQGRCAERTVFCLESSRVASVATLVSQAKKKTKLAASAAFAYLSVSHLGISSFTYFSSSLLPCLG